MTWLHRIRGIVAGLDPRWSMSWWLLLCGLFVFGFVRQLLGPEQDTRLLLFGGLVLATGRFAWDAHGRARSRRAASRAGT